MVSIYGCILAIPFLQGKTKNHTQNKNKNKDKNMNNIQGLKEEPERRSIDLDIQKTLYLDLRELKLNVQERKVKQDEKEVELKNKEMGLRENYVVER